jgi:hypothetical protein
MIQKRFNNIIFNKASPVAAPVNNRSTGIQGHNPAINSNIQLRITTGRGAFAGLRKKGS